MAACTRMYILSVTAAQKVAAVAATVTSPAEITLTVQNLKQVTELIEIQFNGRYLTTEAAMAQFSDIKRSIARGRHETRNLFGQPIVMLMEKEHPVLAEDLSNRLARLQSASRDEMAEF